MKWRTLEADGCIWDVRSIVNSSGDSAGDEELIEFTTLQANMPPRRVVVRGSLAGMDDGALRSAYLRAHPIGGDHYGRPGKRMSDVAS